MNTTRYYTISKLLSAFAEAGLPVSCWWVYKQESKGNLKLPRSTTNFKKVMGIRKAGAVRLVTKTQIDQIVKAFLPGSKGFWHYDK